MSAQKENSVEAKGLASGHDEQEKTIIVSGMNFHRSKITQTGCNDQTSRPYPVGIRKEHNDLMEHNEENHIPVDDVEYKTLMTEVETDNRESEDVMSPEKVLIKYERDFLLRIGNQSKGIMEFKPDAHGFPDLIRGSDLENHIKPNGTLKAKNLPGGRDYHHGRGHGMSLNKDRLVPPQQKNKKHIHVVNGMIVGNWRTEAFPLMVPPSQHERPEVPLRLTKRN